jgi:putative solute:sodium symporter small subunit
VRGEAPRPAGRSCTARFAQAFARAKGFGAAHKRFVFVAPAVAPPRIGCCARKNPFILAPACRARGPDIGRNQRDGRIAAAGRWRRCDRPHDEARGAPGGRKAAGIFTVLRQEERFMQLSQKHQEYWSKNLRITAVLLVIWFFVTFVLGYYARELNFNFFGWPFAFWVGAQGALVVYVLIIWFYARYMNNLDREYDVHEGDE